MASLKDAASLINELSQDTQLELYKSWQHNQEAAVSRLVEIAQEKGKAGYDSATVKRLIEEFIAEVEKNDENENVELSEGELAAVSGGFRFDKSIGPFRVPGTRYTVGPTISDSRPDDVGI